MLLVHHLLHFNKKHIQMLLFSLDKKIFSVFLSLSLRGRKRERESVQKDKETERECMNVSVSKSGRVRKNEKIV